MIAHETKLRQAAERLLESSKKKESVSVRRVMAEQAKRDEENAKNLDKLHVM